MTHFTQRCWGNKSDPTEHNWQKHHGVTIMEAIKTGAAWCAAAAAAAAAARSHLDPLNQLIASAELNSSSSCLRPLNSPHTHTHTLRLNVAWVRLSAAT